MRLTSIQLQWFRGAAESVSLELDGKSVAVYGANGAGKSSFVDAVEYLLCDGRIGHLTHEYSGKKQEKGVINTHKPTLSPTQATLTFEDGSKAGVDVKTNGTFTQNGDGLEHIAAIDYRRVVLRQDEVAAFISSAKGAKYSALLPLLGLEELECAAENVRQLVKRTSKLLNIEEKRFQLSVKTAETSKAFSSVEELEDAISALHKKYRNTKRESDLLSDILAVGEAIRKRVIDLTPDVQRYEALRGLANIRLESTLRAVEEVESDLLTSSIELLPELLLQAA